MTSDEYPHGREVQFDFLCLYARETEKFHDIIKAAYFQSPSTRTSHASWMRITRSIR